MTRTGVVVMSFMFLIHSSATPQLVRFVGIKSGLAITNQDWKYLQFGNGIGSQNRSGLDIGAFVEWLNIPIFSVSTELHYIQKGIKLELPVTTEQFPEGNGTYVTFSPRVDYLSIPILAKARCEFGTSSLYVLVGPRIDVLLTSSGEEFRPVFDDFASSDFGATLGFGLEAFQIGLFTLGAEFRYSPSLEDSYSTNLLTVRNRSFEVLLVLAH